MMELTLSLVLIILGAGIVAGFVAGFVGVGGGIVMVPILLEGFRRLGLPASSMVQAAMGTSLTVGIFSVSSSIVRHARQHRVMWRMVPALAPGSLIGGLLAARLAVILPGQVLQLSLAAIMTLAAIRMFTQKEYTDRETVGFRWWQALLVGLCVGLVAGMSGLAGGIVMVPALALLLGVPTGWLAGTSSAVIIFSALAASVGYLTATPPSFLGEGFVGYVHLPVAGLLALGAIPGAQFGAWTNRRVGSVLFRRIFAVVLLLVVVRLVTTR
jgi:uncharacterized membrane protein YfcA